jgi:predicted porin
MKKSLLALAVLGAFAGAASAQTSNVTVYGKVDLNLSKSNGSTTSMNNGDNSRLGFKGTEDLGGGLKANFQLEQRFDADTGTTEGNGRRPLFQGRSWVGLSGGFGAIRLGRDLTPKQAYAGNFDPWGADRGRGAFDPDLMDAGYASDPLNGGNSANNRWSNAAYYTSPTFAGFKVDAAVASRETLGFGTPSSTPFSLAAGYDNGPIGAMAAYERNALNSKIWQLGASYDLGVAKLMATFAKTKIDSGVAVPTGAVNQTLGVNGALAASTVGANAKAWTIGAYVPVGPGRLLAGYGQSKADDFDAKFKKAAIGYEYVLSKRTFLYADYINYKKKYGGLAADSTSNTFDVGIDHSF